MAFFYLQIRKEALKINANLYSYLNIIKLHDFGTYLHCQRVAQVSLCIGKCIGLDRNELKSLWYAALLHDLGKINIPKDILNRAAKLTLTEWEIIHQHPIDGARILQAVKKIDRDVISGIIAHHERWNGKGYPYGLVGENIPLGGRIITVADALDAMTSVRPYRKTPLPVDEALVEIKSNADKQFDPFIVGILCRQEQLQVVLTGLMRRIS